MTQREVERRIQKLETELAACEAEEKRLAKRVLEMNMRRVTPDAKARKRLELKAVTEKINGLRLQLWGLRNLNLPG